MWPHLLSLDAPLVALVWQRWWARAAGVTLPWSREMILGLGVWLIYLADRLADTVDVRPGGTAAARHIFSRRYRDRLALLAAGISATLAILTPCWLPGDEFRSGLCLLALALGYFGLIHGWTGRGWAAWLPKEAAVGGMFGTGTVFFVVCRWEQLPASFWLVSGLFAVLCFLNCALITRWERLSRDLRDPSSLLNAFPRFCGNLRAACVALALAAVVVAVVTASPIAIPLAASALLLAALDVCERRISVEMLRVLADMVLLTPLIGFILDSR